jgi:hypothetical protein
MEFIEEAEHTSRNESREKETVTFDENEWEHYFHFLYSLDEPDDEDLVWFGVGGPG